MHSKLVIGVLIAVWGLLGSVLVGCSANAANPPGPVGESSTAGDPALAGASAEQLTVLADGLVTREERDEAFSRLESCLARFGIQVVERSSPSGSGSSFTTAAPQHTAPEVARVQSDSCVAAEFLGVMRQWDYQNRPSPERLDEARSSLISCLREEGVKLSGHPRSEDLVEVSLHTAPAEFHKCSTLVGDAYALPGFGG